MASPSATPLWIYFSRNQFPNQLAARSMKPKRRRRLALPAHSKLRDVLFDDRFQLFCCRCWPKIWRCKDRILKSRAAFTGSRLVTKTLHRLAHDYLGVAHVLIQILDDRLDSDSVMTGMPAIVIGHQRQRRVANLRFARELGLLQIRHADNVHPPGTIGV